MSILKSGKKVTTLLTLLVVLFSTITPFSNNYVSAKENTSYITMEKAEGELNISQKENISEEYGYDPQEKVRVIVELEEGPVLDYYSTKSKQEPSEFINSNKGKEIANNIMGEQDSVMKKISEKVDASFKDNYRYTVVMNGFSLETKRENIEKIEKISGVKRIFEAVKYELPAEANNDIQMKNSSVMIGADQAQALGYEGEKTIVAILDTGLDTNHEAFQKDPQNSKYSKSDISSLISSVSLNAGDLSSDDVFASQKVPFGYDYADKDPNVIGDIDHGTHVAGTIAANSDKIKGIAPEAQLMIMKVFSDGTGSAYDDDILAALDDSVSLGADSINMSLGSGAGFTKIGEEAVKEAYTRVSESGVNLLMAAGNDDNAVVNNTYGTNMPLASNPDNAVVSSPSTFAAGLSVASVENTVYNSPYFKVGDENIPYKNASNTDGDTYDVLETLDNKEYAYVMVPGIGEEKDYSELDVKDKIAVVQRGTITFTEKAQEAAKAGAVAIVIYNNQNGDATGIGLSEETIPVISIASKYEAILAKNLDETIKFSKEYFGEVGSPVAGLMSTFSSIGPSPDLKIKPEITAPGGNIYSTLIGNKYGAMSGTSMATPHLAGAAAAVKEYVNEKFSSLSQVEKTNLVSNLLMSTATPVKDQNGVYAPVRKQGAGLINVANAIQTKAYLTVDGDKPKAELGSSESGKYSYKFTINNFSSDQNITYNVNTKALSAKIKVVNNNKFMSEEDIELTDDQVIITYSGLDSDNNVTVSPNSKKTISVTISLTEKGKADLDSNFENGIYIEGYTSLYDEKGDHATLSLPFLGYYGNWTDPSIFDNTVYDKIQPTTQTSTIMINSNAAGSGYYLGRNAITGKYDKEKIAFSPSLNGDNSRIFTSITSLLRNAENLSFKIKDANDKDVWSYVYGDARKTFFSSTQGAYIPILNMQGWNGKDEKGQQVPSGTELIYEVSGKIAGTDTEKTLDLPFTVDTEAPTVENVDIVKEDSKVYLTFDVKDDNYIQQILVGDVAGHVLLFELGIDYVEKKGETSTVRADITNLGEELANQSLNPGRLSIFGFDYAYNISTNYVDIGPQAIVLDKYLDLTIGESKKVNATVKPENLADKSLTWTSSDDKIATVDADGVVTGIAKGEVTITATAVTGLTSSIKVYVDTDVPGEGETEDPDEENPEQPDEDDAIGYSDMSIDADHSIISKDLNDTFQYENFYYKVTSNDEVQLIGEPDKLFSSYDTIKGNVYIPSEVENNGKKYKVTSIGAKAFYFNNSITSIEFSEGLKVIGESAFFYASALSNVKMPDSVERIDDNAFNGASITKINIPKNIKSIGSFAFLFIDAFEELTLPEGLESIGEQSFGFVSSMKKLILPDTLKYIGEAAFTVSASLETVKLPEKMKAVPKFMFFKASSLKEIEFPTSVTSIGYGSFQSSGLTTIDIPETVTKVEKFAFADISSLEKIVIPNSVKEIGTYAFAQSTKANEVKIGKNVKTIGKDAFTGISREAAVNVANDQVAFELRRSGFTNPFKSGGVSFTDYVSGQFMVGSLIYRPTSATTVEVTQFEKNKKLQELVIPETVTNEGDNITYTVTSVYDYVFQGNQDLKKITLPDTITKIGERAFDQINGLDTMNIPENLQLVEEYGLNYLGWDPLLASEWTEKELTIPDGLTHLKAVSFSGNKYESINIANGTKKIPAYTFYGNKKAEKLEIPNSVEMIESNAFADLESLKELNLPDNLKYIGGNAFSGLNSIDKVALPNSVEYIGDYAFNSMVGSSIKDVSLGNGVNAYGWNSFNEEANVTVSLNSQREDIVKFNNLKQTPELIWDGEVDISTTDASVIPEGKKVSVIGDRTIDGNLTINGTLEIAKDASLTINGTLKINGKITGKGTLIISEDAQIGDIDPEVFIPVTSIKITKSIAITEDKGTAQIEAEVYPTFATNKDLNYDLISGDEFASVNEKGVITAKGNGQIVVRVSAADQFGTYVDLNVTISGQSEVIDDEQDPENPDDGTDDEQDPENPDDGTEDEQDSENPGKGIDNDNTNTVNQENNKNSQNVSKIGNGSGKESNGTHQLPETGTHSYNYLLIGFILIFVSILFLYIARRKKQVNQAK